MFFKYIIKKKGKINKIKALHFVYCVFEAALRSNATINPNIAARPLTISASGVKDQ